MAISGGPQAPQDGDLWRPWPRIPLRRLPPWGAWGPPEIAILDPPGGGPSRPEAPGAPGGGISPTGRVLHWGVLGPPSEGPRGAADRPPRGALIHGGRPQVPSGP